MALVLSDDKKSLIIVDSGPPSRPSLLSNREFCEHAGKIMAYLETLPIYRSSKNVHKVFLNSFIERQFNQVVNELISNNNATAEKEEENGDEETPVPEPFTIDQWYIENRGGEEDEEFRKTETETGREDIRFKILRAPGEAQAKYDWLTPLFEQELRTPGFAAAFSNSISIEDMFQDQVKDRAGSAPFIGDSFLKGMPGGSHSMFGKGARGGGGGGGGASFFTGGGILAPNRGNI
jgi:hypothetical protein